MRRGLEILNIKISLVETIEQHEGVGACVVEAPGHVGHRTEEWRQLNSDRDFQAGFYMMYELAITALNDIAAFRRVSFESVEVKFDCVGTGLLHFAGMANPSAGRGAVQAGDYGNSDGLLRLTNQLQVAFRPCVVGLEIWEIGDSLGEFIGAAREVLIDHNALERELFFEERGQDSGGDAGVLQAADLVNGFRKGRRGSNERVLQRKAHVLRGKVNHLAPPRGSPAGTNSGSRGVSPGCFSSRTPLPGMAARFS